MAKAIITLKIMPESPDTDLEKVQEAALEKIKGFAGEGETRKEIEKTLISPKDVKVKQKVLVFNVKERPSTNYSSIYNDNDYDL